MSDVARCLGDGYSTAGSLGTGLGSIARVADSFGIYSQPGGGTALWARVDSDPGARGPAETGPDLAAINVAAPGEPVCGDDWAVAGREGRTLVLLADGLGHGPQAAAAAAAAAGLLDQAPSGEPVALIEAAHAALRGTRGAALAVARLDPRRGELRFAGVGNIAGVVVDARTGRSTRLVSQNGTVGHAVRKIQAFDYPWAEDARLILHSDGLSARWDLDGYPGLIHRHPGLLAGVLYRDFRRERDDVTVIVLSQGGPPS
jgi:hypothetical protein